MQVSPCMLSFGGCGCVYHEHCVSHWLLKRNVCPVGVAGGTLISSTPSSVSNSMSAPSIAWVTGMWRSACRSTPSRVNRSCGRTRKLT